MHRGAGSGDCRAGLGCEVSGSQHDSSMESAQLCFGSVLVLSSDLTQGILREGLRSSTLEHVMSRWGLDGTSKQCESSHTELF